jgi:hypothetical protein
VPDQRNLRSHQRCIGTTTNSIFLAGSAPSSRSEHVALVRSSFRPPCSDPARQQRPSSQRQVRSACVQTGSAIVAVPLSCSLARRIVSYGL